MTFGTFATGADIVVSFTDARKREVQAARKERR